MNAAASNQKSVPLIPISPTLLPSKNRVDTYRTLVATAIKHNLAPLKLDLTGVERTSVFMQPALFAKVSLAATNNDMSFQEAFAGLTAAGVEFIQSSQRAIAGVAQEVKVPFNTNRPEQAKYFQGIQAGLKLNKIVLAEASTGVGKGRALCAAAIEAAIERKTPVVVTAPTLKVLGQLWSEMTELRTNDGLGKKLTYSFYPGASEFVDDLKLKEFMIDHLDDPEVTQWMNKNGPMLEKNNPLIDAMRSMGVQPSFLMEDLSNLAVNMDVSDFVLTSQSESESGKVLKDIRERAIGADIIFCTHTMLALSHRLNWALVPQPALLIIDEAHMFEQALASVHSDSLSLSSLIARLRKSGVPNKSVKAVQELMYFLKINADDNFTLINMNAANDSFKIEAIDRLNAVYTILKAKTYKDVINIDIVKKVILNTISVLNGQAKDSSYLSFSPDRRYPSIATGKADLGLVLGGLWKGIDGGVLLASATLFIKNTYGDDKCDYICDVLQIPTSRLHATQPVISPWLTSKPTLHTPSPELALKLTRPSIQDEPLTKIWLENLSSTLFGISQQTKGGTLVLATSYVQISTIVEHLIKLGLSPDRIIQQDRNLKISVTEKLFREAYSKGLRPIWIGLGSAWTGLNLTDTDKSNVDNLLTDLVILCSPLNLNRTNTMIARVEARSISPIIKEALMMLKQGLGRLMRDESQDDRHIWFLDGRIYGQWKQMEEFQKSTLKLLSLYKNYVSII